ncbi:MAG: hypothetical protein KAJ49_03405 [Arcobacteraceae bacterium]|nr:hypothetical protein [Arcobacteraceae bacterium]
MGNRHISLLIVMAILMMPMVVAQPVYEQDTNVTLSIPCTVSGAVCGGTATCVGTILNPDGNTLYNNQAMTQNGAVFELNITASDTSTLGEYEFSVSCTQTGKSSSKTLTFWVTPNGELPTTSKGIIYIGLLAVFIIFFGITLYGGKEAENVVGKGAFFLTSYLILIGISFLAWNLSLDYLTSAPFMASFFRIFWLFLMYAFFPILLLLTFYTLWMMKKIDVIQNMIDKGMPVDEAYERTVKGGMARRKQW